MRKLGNKRYYINTSSNFFNTSNIKSLFKGKKLFKNISNLQISGNQNTQLPVLNSYDDKRLSQPKYAKKLKIKKSGFLKSQEKLSRLIKEEEHFKQFYLNLIKNKVNEEKNEFNNFLLESHEINDNDPVRNNFINDNKAKNDENSPREERLKRKIEREEEKIYSPYPNIGKNKTNSNDYIERLKSLFPGEQSKEEYEFQKKTKNAIIIQRFFREHKNKKRIYTGLEDPDYIIRIYEHDHSLYDNIKSIEIKIYSVLFKKNVKMIKTMEELFGVLALTRENIINKIGEIIEKIIGTKRNKKKNKIYYDPNFADLSSDDFDDFEDDNE
jgi:hypothetical protein